MFLIIKVAILSDDFIYLGSVISNEDGSRGDITKAGKGLKGI